MTLVSILLVGFMLGIKHATEADHLAAVSTVATGQSSFGQIVRHGVAWGVGHTLTLLLLGGVVLALGSSIPNQAAQALEFAVGLMLVVLGADVLRRLVRRRIQVLDGAFEIGLTHGQPVGGARKPPLRALAIGMMHGMAGSAALILLSLNAVQSLHVGLAYIAVFGAGSIVGMAVLSVLIAIPLRLSARYFERLHDGMTAFIGIATCVLGGTVMYSIGTMQDFFPG